MNELIVGIISGLIFGVCVCMIIPIAIIGIKVSAIAKDIDSKSNKYNTMLSALSDNFVGTLNEVDKNSEKINMLTENYNYLSSKIDDLDEKIGGEDWKEMVEAEKQYAISLANLASYSGEEQT